MILACSRKSSILPIHKILSLCYIEKLTRPGVSVQVTDYCKRNKKSIPCLPDEGAASKIKVI